MVLGGVSQEVCCKNTPYKTKKQNYFDKWLVKKKVLLKWEITREREKCICFWQNIISLHDKVNDNSRSVNLQTLAATANRKQKLWHFLPENTKQRSQYIIIYHSQLQK